MNPGNLVKRIEHYANARDPVPMIGVLSEVNNPDFHGEIFVNDARGHLFNTFYSLHARDYKPLNEGAVSTLLQVT